MKSQHRFRPKRWHLLADFARKLNKATDSESGALLPGIAAGALKDLSRDLLKIAGGMDARQVFEQKAQRGNGSRSIEAYNAACAYWHARLADPAASDAPAIAAAQQRYLIDPPDSQSIRRVARKYRVEAIRALQGWEYFRDETGKPRKKCRMDHDTKKLEAYLACKSKGSKRRGDR